MHKNRTLVSVKAIECFRGKRKFYYEMAVIAHRLSSHKLEPDDTGSTDWLAKFHENFRFLWPSMKFSCFTLYLTDQIPHHEHCI